MNIKVFYGDRIVQKNPYVSMYECMYVCMKVSIGRHLLEGGVGGNEHASLVVRAHLAVPVQQLGLF